MLIKVNGAPPHVVENEFAFAADGDALPEGPAIVSLKRFVAEKDSLLSRNAPLGVKLDTSQSPELLGDVLHKLAVVEFHVPYFRDGRAYSWARLLRTRLGYEGEIRISGHVLQDQVAFYTRVGADAFVLPKASPDDIRLAVGEISEVYQPSVDGRRTILDMRKANGTA